MYKVAESQVDFATALTYSEYFGKKVGVESCFTIDNVKLKFMADETQKDACVLDC